MKLGSVSNLIVVPDDADPVLGRIEKAAQLGLGVLGVNLRETWRDADYLRQVSELGQRLNLELRTSTGGANFYLQGAEAEAEVAQVAERLLTIARHTTIRFFSTPAGPMLTTHRWTDGPPLAERMSTVARNLAVLADAVAGAGLTIGLENHCDYRGHEIAAIIEEANRPNLRAQLDTGNAFSVFEDPIDCARALAPYTVSCHLKDIHVTPFATGACLGTRAVTVPLGRGHVDNAAICRILQDLAPEPAGIALMVEPFYLPEDMAPSQFLAISLDWARTALAPFID